MPKRGGRKGKKKVGANADVAAATQDQSVRVAEETNSSTLRGNDPTPAGAIPTNVSVWYPADPSAFENARTATIFTRLDLAHTPQQVAAAMGRTAAIKQSFCLGHQNAILVFDKDIDTHTEHVRAVLHMCRANSMRSNIYECVFDANTAAEAGFQLEALSNGRAFMVVDMGAPSADN
ncbi:hypothetical protein BU16DRAFT_540844 [Lophium mytilinum]|uniref:Uncharacterized protein n=1 Tax=Lophium mytilinum TaxID=390894 RepID=A0A6A6QMZ7_9PEZI|nr:hypothetical protein BU16DRAFT_540844 [Lophium mytilinum]